MIRIRLIIKVNIIISFYCVHGGWSLFFKCIPSCPKFIYRRFTSCTGLVQVAIEHQPRRFTFYYKMENFFQYGSILR